MNISIIFFHLFPILTFSDSTTNLAEPNEMPLPYKVLIETRTNLELSIDVTYSGPYNTIPFPTVALKFFYGE